MVPTGTRTPIELNETLASTGQQTDLQLRVSHGGPVEVRLTEPLFCKRRQVVLVEQVRLEERSLSTGGKALMWTGYAGAAAVAGLVGTGLANGSDVKPGLFLMGIFGAPLAAVGAGQSLAARDRSHPAPPIQETVDLERAACHEPAGGWEVHLRRDDVIASLHVGTAWTSVAAPEGTFPADHGTFEGIAEASWPVSLEAERLVAQVDDALERQIAAGVDEYEARQASRQAEQATAELIEHPAQQSSPSPAMMVASDIEPESPPAPAPPAPAPPAPACDIRQTSAGWLPAAFFAQPVREYEVVDGDSLSHISRRLLGDPMLYRELLVLNGDQIRDAALIFPGQQIRVPLEGRSLQSWHDDIDPACLEKR